MIASYFIALLAVFMAYKDCERIILIIKIVGKRLLKDAQ